MDEKGFGLLEAALAAMVAGLLAAVAMPRLFFHYQALALDHEAARLAAALSAYREEAVYAAAQRQEFLDAGKYTVPEFRLEKNSYMVIVNGKIRRRHTLPSGIEMNRGRKTVDFYGTGNAEPMTITLRSGTQQRYVIIDLAGRIRVSLAPP